ncbi:unnamed protein product, partial [marine sediment metagenome]
KNDFDSLNLVIIKEKLNHTIPETYEIKVNLTCSDDDLGSTQTIEVGSSLPNTKFIGAGKRYFVIGADEITHYCFARYWVWQK